MIIFLTRYIVCHSRKDESNDTLFNRIIDPQISIQHIIVRTYARKALLFFWRSQVKRIKLGMGYPVYNIQLFFDRNLAPL